jgi:rhomboid family protein
MLPLTDETRHPLRFPAATYAIIGLNILVFLLEWLLGDPFINRYALVPNDIIQGHNLITLVTSMFLHEGLLHIGGNMLYLWVFGPNLEDVMGPFLFTIYYLICGFVASAAQIAIDPASTIPSLGASGAIAGVLGGFILEFPHDEIRTLAPIGFGFITTRLSAIILLGFWFVLQLVSGVGEVASQAQGMGGVAFFAHIGGFVAGIVLVKLFARRPASGVGVQY